MKQVVIVQSVMKQYRLPFYEALNSCLARAGVRLLVVYSAPNENERRRNDNVELPAEFGRKAPARWFLQDRCVYQSIYSAVKSSDLVVVEHANKYILNPMLVCLSLCKVRKVAFWGMGGNRLVSRRSWGERFKQFMARHADCSLAYTTGTAELMRAYGVDQNKITVVHNATDTRRFSESVGAVSVETVQRQKRELRISDDAIVGLYCGALTALKLGLLLESAKRIRAKLPNFHLILAGDGIESSKIKSYCDENPWAHWVGAKFGESKAVYFRMADCFLMPGAVGLAILDAFAAGLPLCTMDHPHHGPEIEYLADGVNGLLTQPCVETYVSAVVDLLKSPDRLLTLKNGAAQSGKHYTVENMAQCFADGVTRCINSSDSVSVTHPDSFQRGDGAPLIQTGRVD